MDLQKLWKAVLPLGCLTGTAVAIEVMWKPFSTSLAEHRWEATPTLALSPLQPARGDLRLQPVPAAARSDFSVEEAVNGEITRTEGLFPSWGKLLGRSEPASRPQTRTRDPRPQQPQFQPGDDLTPTPDPHFSGGGRAVVRPLPQNPFPSRKPQGGRERPIPAESDPRYSTGAPPIEPPLPSAEIRQDTRSRRANGSAPTLAEPLPPRRPVPEEVPDQRVESVPERQASPPAQVEANLGLPPVPTLPPAPKLPAPVAAGNGPSLLAPANAAPQIVESNPVKEAAPEPAPRLEPVPVVSSDPAGDPVPVRKGTTLPPPPQKIAASEIPRPAPPSLQPEPDPRNGQAPSAPVHRPQTNNPNNGENSRGFGLPRIGDGFRRFVPGIRR